MPEDERIRILKDLALLIQGQTHIHEAIARIEAAHAECQKRCGTDMGEVYGRLRDIERGPSWGPVGTWAIAAASLIATVTVILLYLVGKS